MKDKNNTTEEKKIDTGDFIKGIYMNREYSWLLFNKRVLEQSLDVTNPLLERCRFLSIFSSNLDEFFMVRIGSLYNASLSTPDKKDNKTQLTAKKQMEGICEEVRKYYSDRRACFYTISRELSKCGVKILNAKNLSPKQYEDCKAIFRSSVMPLVTIMVLDARMPIMQFENMRDYMLFDLEKDGHKMIGVMAMNTDIPKIFRTVSTKDKAVALIPLEELLREFGGMAFQGFEIRGSMLMRVTRNADFDASADQRDVKSFPKAMKRKVESRASMNVVRLEIDRSNSYLRDFVMKLVHIDKQYCFKDVRFFDYKFLNGISSFIDKDKVASLKYPPFKGAIPPEIRGCKSYIDHILSGHDVLLSYPYDSVNPVLDLLSECAVDDRVKAIKITIYRLDKHSRIADYLCKASENGKHVTVVIELQARFDEENNMYFAEKLQEAGCEIIYGMENYKVHSKILSIVLQDGDKVSHITHIATGNYNESTSRQYTDLNLLTSDETIGEDGDAFFRNMSLSNIDYRYEKLLVAPKTLKPGLIEYIDREISKAKRGKPASIICKMNSLTDKELMEKFVEASQAGVRIDLIIRGICCLLPGIPEKTENINVISIVGRFLEHSRVFHFGDGDDSVTFFGSADLMTRNTDRRVEIAVPVENPVFEKRIVDMLKIMLSDNVKARRLCADGRYVKIEKLGEQIDAQAKLLKMAEEEQAQ
ncbi:MAG: polyphosphate kinase 1 [Clostridia bacterium]|nr:polyphosphate kinase 1 [Clostridia bacterium]